MIKQKPASNNIVVYLLLFLGLFLILAGRLFVLQIVEVEKYKTQAASNSVRLINLPTKRGDILDANGEMLATSIPIASIVLDTNADEASYEMTVHNLAILLGGLGYDEKKINDTIMAANKKGIYGSIEIIRIQYEQPGSVELISRFYERASYMTAASVSIIPTRFYPQGVILGNTIGYVGTISKEEYDAGGEVYGLNDIIGKLGLEKSLEFFKKEGTELKGLMGTKGSQSVEVDNQGRIVAVRSEENSSIPGDNVQLTIDLRIQRAMESALDSQINLSKAFNENAGAGAAIAFNVNNGQILAMSSKPDLNPNDFLGGLSESLADYYLKNPQAPMLNKVTSAAYPPGSTFKMITAFAGLHYSGLTAEYTETCTGAWKDLIKCTGTHGTIGLLEAMTVSCNVYFQSFGEKATIENIAKTARQFGLGVDTGFTDMNGVVKGFLPTPESKASYEKNYMDGMIKKINEQTAAEIVAVNQNTTLTSSAKKEQIKLLEAGKADAIARVEKYYKENRDWYTSDTDLVSIGQGLNNYSVLQLGEYISTIANGGTRYKPTIIKSITSANGTSVYTVAPVVLNKVEMTPEEIAVVKEGMRLVTTVGTARNVFRNTGLSVAGKTGTAETGRSGDVKDEDYHGVFVGYYPVDNPQIAVACIVEYGKGNATAAANVARAVFEAYRDIQ